MAGSRLFISVVLATLSGGMPPAHSQATGEPIRIPVMTPLSGALAILGQDSKKGIEIAIEQINREGGVAGRPLALDFADSQGKPDVARREMERLARLQNAPFVLGCDISAATAGAAQFAEAAQIPLINAGAVSSEILDRHYHWYFTQQITSNDESEAVLAFLKKIVQPSGLQNLRIALLYEDSPRGAGTGGLVKQLLEKEGIKTTAEVSYNRSERNLLPFVKKVQETGPEILVWIGYTEDVVAGMKAMQQLEFSPYVVGVGGGPGDPRLPELVDPKLIERLRVSNVDYFNADLGRAAKLTAEYRKRYNATPSSYVGMCYSAAITLKQVLELAYKKSAAPTRTDFQEVLRTFDIPGDRTAIPAKFIRFDKDGRNVGAQALVAQFKDGGTRKVTVFPPELAVAEPTPLK